MTARERVASLLDESTCQYLDKLVEHLSRDFGLDKQFYPGDGVVSGHSLIDGFFFSSRRRHTRFDCDWSSDVCSSDLALGERLGGARPVPDVHRAEVRLARVREIGRASCRERAYMPGGGRRLKNKHREAARC